MKRTLSILLALLMLVSLVPFHALAENVEGTEVEEQEQDQEEKQEVQEEKEEDKEDGKVSVEVTVEDKTEEVTGETEEENPVEESQEETEEIEISEEEPKEAVGNPEPNVTLVGQWTGESTKKENTPKHYELTDKIGPPITNDGLLRKLAKQFLGWSDKAPEDNGVLAEGAKLFSPEDTIADVFGDEIPADAKIYAVYYEINNPYGDPLPSDPTANLAIAGILQKLKENVNKNTIRINNDVEADGVLKNTENHKVDNDVIIDYYEKKDDKDSINEVVLKSEFEMDWVVAMLAYRNEIGSSQLRPILSRSYFRRFKGNKYSKEEIELKKPEDENKIDSFPLADGEKAGYTHVDLTIDFGSDEGLVVPEKLFLEFKSYSWRPLFVYGEKEDGEKEVLKIFDLDESPKGNNPDAFNSLLVDQKPETQFGVETNKYRKINIRVVLRKWGGRDVGYKDDKILESNIPKGPEKTVASEILSNMTLRVMGSEDKIKNDYIVRVTDKKAKELADGEGKENIEIKGSIKGQVFASAGIIPYSFLNIPLMSNIPINKLDAEKGVKISYVYKQEEPEPKPEPKPEPYDPGYRYDPSPDYLNKKPQAKERTFDLYRWYVKGNEGDFMPYKGITRAEIAEIFARALDYDKTYFDDSHVNYPDVDQSAWYAKAVARVTNAGIFKGTDEGNFEPTREITQGELISTLKRFQKLNDSMDNIMTMRDDHWARAEVNAAAKEGWLKIYQDGIKAFDVDKVITREEVVAIANKAFARPVDQRYIDEYIDSLKTFKDINKDMWSYYEILTAANTYFVNYDNKDSRYDLWVNHATYDDGPATAIEDIKTYKEILNNDEYKTKVDQVRFQRDLYR